MQGRVWYALWLVVFVVVLILWATAPILLWKTELVVRAWWWLIVIVEVVYCVWKRNHNPSIFLS